MYDSEDKQKHLEVFMNILSFLLYCFVVTFTPGPTNIVILSSVQRDGPRKTMNYIYGATLAFGILLAASALLNSLIAGAIPGTLQVLSIAGSVYMLYLAVQMFKTGTGSSDARYISGFAGGLVMQFINPKVILFTFTVMPGYVLPYYDSAAAVILFVLLVTAIGFLAFAFWMAFGAVFRPFLQSHQRALNVIMGLFLVYSAAAVAGFV